VRPGAGGEDLARKLAQRRADAAYRRQRQIQQFSHRFRFAGVLVTTLFILLGYIGYLLAQRRPQPLWMFLAWAALILAWGYLLLLPATFAWRTGLRAYVLRKHWLWLSLALGLPIDVYLLPALFPAESSALWLRLPLVFFACLLVGLALRPARTRAFEAEVRRHAARWDRLLELGVVDIALLGFWRLGQAISEEEGT
jgi:cation transport ATPase